jgi:hypothetical protein
LDYRDVEGLGAMIDPEMQAKFEEMEKQLADVPPPSNAR